MVWAVLAFIGVFLPFVFLGSHLFERKRPFLMIFALGISFVLGFVFCVRHHQGHYLGLDSMAYANLSDAIRSGRPLVSTDSLISQVPQSLQSAFLYRPLSSNKGRFCRPTRDTAFQINFQKSAESRPFFQPFLPLAEAGSFLKRNFIPCIGALFFLLLLWSAIRKTGARGILPSIALLSSTPYFFWFFRGEFSECLAFPLLAIVLLANGTNSLRGSFSYWIAAFAIGYSVCFHPTAFSYAIPIAFLSLLNSKSWQERSALFCGGFFGFAPLWLCTRYVCSPYGNWTQWSSLQKIFTSNLEHSVLFCAVVALFFFSVVILSLLKSKSIQTKIHASIQKIPLWAWITFAFLPFLFLLASSSVIRSRLCLAFCFAWKSWHFAPLFLWGIGSYAILRSKNQKLCLTWLLFTWVSSLFFLVLGQEAMVNHGRIAGVWGFRRLLPIVLMNAALFAIPITELWLSLKKRVVRHALIASMVVASLLNFTLSPKAYLGIDGRGSEKFVREISNFLDEEGNPLVIFDYFPHSTPFSSSPNRNVLGLGEHARNQWPEVIDWLAAVAKTGSVFVASSYSPVSLEKDFLLAPVRNFSFTEEHLVSHHFLDVRPKSKLLRNSFSRVLPLPDNQLLQQQISFDGSPIGLRGNWFFKRSGGAWSESESYVLGPLPQPGTNVVLRMEASWFPPDDMPSNRLVHIDFPGNPYAAFQSFQSGRETNELAFISYKPLPKVGLYRLKASSLYDPAKYGLNGYPNDLGLFFHSISIEQVIENRPK